MEVSLGALGILNTKAEMPRTEQTGAPGSDRNLPYGAAMASIADDDFRVWH